MQAPSNYTKAQVDSHLSSLSNGVVLKALNVFINTIPELAILHLPTFVDDFMSERSPENKLLLAAVLTVTKGQVYIQKASWDDQLLPRDHYALYTRELLAEFMLASPKIHVVQALLIITLYEWGTRNFHKAWVYCGMNALPR